MSTPVTKERRPDHANRGAPHNTRPVRIRGGIRSRVSATILLPKKRAFYSRRATSTRLLRLRLRCAGMRHDRTPDGGFIRLLMGRRDPHPRWHPRVPLGCIGFERSKIFSDSAGLALGLCPHDLFRGLAMIAARIGLHHTGIDSEPLTPDESGRHAGRNDALEYVAKHVVPRPLSYITHSLPRSGAVTVDRCEWIARWRTPTT